jgi:diacylglycerol kinase (ATP)
LDHNLIFYTKANRIKVKPADKMQLNIDGEYGGSLPGEFVNLHQHIEYFVTDEFIKKQDSLQK